MKDDVLASTLGETKNIDYLNETKKIDQEEKIKEAEEIVDYGKEFFVNLLKSYKRKIGVSNPDFNSLLDYFKIIKKVHNPSNLYNFKNKTINSGYYTLQIHYNNYIKNKITEEKIGRAIFLHKIELENYKKEEHKKELMKKYLDKNKNINNKEKNIYDELILYTIKSYKTNNPNDKNYLYPDKLYEYYDSLDESNKIKINLKKEEIKNTFINYFYSRADYVFNEYKTVLKLQPNSSKDLIRFFNFNLNSKKKKELNLNFESKKNLKLFFDKYVNYYNENIKKIEVEQKQKIENLKKIKERTRGRKKSMYFNDSFELSNDKISKKRKKNTYKSVTDRLKLGKSLLSLNRTFKNDNIIKKLIKDEFKNVRVVKKPLEYYDFDLEIYKDKKEKNDYYIDKLYENHQYDVNKLKKTLNDDYSKRKINFKKLEKEKILINKYIMEKAEKYKKLRAKRYDQIITQEFDYLIEVYNYLYDKYPDTMDIIYKSYQVKKNGKKIIMFPLKFKHKFYSFFKDKKYWKANGKYKVDIVNKNLNKKFKKPKEVNNNFWLDDKYKKEKTNFLMKFDEINNCYFYPNKVNKINKDDDNNGKNYKENNIDIYEQGVFDQLLIAFKKGNYESTYDDLITTFDLYQIKLFFNEDFNKIKGYCKEKFEANKKDGGKLVIAKDTKKYKLYEKINYLAKEIEKKEINLIKSKKRTMNYKLKNLKDSKKDNYNTKIVLCPNKVLCKDYNLYKNEKLKGNLLVENKCKFSHTMRELGDNLQKDVTIIINDNQNFDKVNKWNVNDPKNTKDNAPKIINRYKNKSQERNFLLKNNKKKKDENNLFQKIGYYRKSLALYNNEKYYEALYTLLKAYKIIKTEKNDKSKTFNSYCVNLKKKLGIDVNLNITKKLIFKVEKAQKGTPNEEDDNNLLDINLQALKIYADKIGIYNIYNFKDSDSLIKSNIQELYNKISIKIRHLRDGIVYMNNTLKRLKNSDEELHHTNNEYELRRKRLLLVKNKICENIKKYKKCDLLPNCEFAHNATELEIRTKNLKFEILNTAIENQKNQPTIDMVKESWRPVTSNGARNDHEKIDIYFAMMKKVKEDDKNGVEDEKEDEDKKSFFDNNEEDLVNNILKFEDIDY